MLKKEQFEEYYSGKVKLTMTINKVRKVTTSPLRWKLTKHQKGTLYIAKKMQTGIILAPKLKHKRLQKLRARDRFSKLKFERIATGNEMAT